jgi:hypothetical protein
MTSIAQRAEQLRLKAQREAEERARYGISEEWMRLRSTALRWPRLLVRQNAAATRDENPGPRF